MFKIELHHFNLRVAVICFSDLRGISVMDQRMKSVCFACNVEETRLPYGRLHPKEGNIQPHRSTEKLLYSFLQPLEEVAEGTSHMTQSRAYRSASYPSAQRPLTSPSSWPQTLL